ncbi:hypothetical protein OJF2_06900 [Aquisphaera giovannonii]|uniref:Uncharacterized protein n=1 Tax=Aquisphaera giovannonii TaxID=406548 RepID=A0A5B9VWI1_9BACT|nr:hypothetical protein [Aquisphaera giovannonii]QEH32221.1 hypothetical protein OJF2_06900 [Aquisphaera giovannonii]
MDDTGARGGSEGSKQKPKRPWRRRLCLAALLLVAAGGLLLWALPWMAGLSPSRLAIVARVNRALAPSRVEVGGLSISWFGTIRATGLSLTDKDGKVIVTAEGAELDRGLAALLIDPSRLGTITVDGAKADIERRADGSIDLVDALTPPRPAEKTPPPRGEGKPLDLTLKIVRSAVVVRSPELVEPITAGQAEVTVRLPAAADKKLGWQVRLATPPGGIAEQTLAVDGEFDHRAEGSPDTAVRIAGKDWPLAIAAGGLVTRGRLDGEIRAGRSAGRWGASGEADVLGLDVDGPALAGDRLKLDAVKGSWDLAQDGGAWAIRKLAVDCPVGSLGAAATVGGDPAKGADAHLEGRIDLAALARLIPRALRLREGIALDRGEARVVLDLKTAGDAQEASLEANVSDLAGREGARVFTLGAPATLVARGRRSAAGLTVDALELKSAFASLKGSGDPGSGIKVSGTFDLAAVQAQFRELIDFGGVALAGRGGLAADYRREKSAFIGRGVLEVRGLDLAGLAASPYSREVLRLEVDATGPADPAGLPASWAELRAKFQTPREVASLAATSRDGAVAWKGAASLPVALATRSGRAGAESSGRWTTAAATAPGRGVIEVDELRLNARPDDPALAADGLLLASVRGRLDLDADELTVAPLPPRPGEKTPLELAGNGLKLRGLLKNPSAPESADVEVRGDLAAIDRALAIWTGQAGSGLAGPAAARIIAEPDGGRLKLRLAAKAPAALGGKAVDLAFRGAYEAATDRLDCQSLTAVTPYARVDASGQVVEATARRVADLSGTLAPDWQALTAIVEQAVEAEARLEGRPRGFRVKGPLSGGSLAAIVKGLEEAELGVDLTSADVFGLALGEAPVVVRCKGGVLAVDRIQTTLNEGRVDLRPGLTVDDAQGIAVLLGEGSALSGVKVNDEVSRRVLSYVAPVLDRATHVSGTIAADMKGEIPITGPPSRTTTLNGHLAFQDVVFAPGPAAAEVLSVVGRRAQEGIRMQQPVQLSIANRRVIQEGLKVTVRQGVDVGLKGSVGFDQTLELKATVPITKAMLGSQAPAQLGDALRGNDITIPIGGTVSHPTVDRRALRVALGNLSKGAVRQGLQKEASKLLDRLGPPPAAGPGTPPGARRPRSKADALEGLEDQLLRRVLPGGKP